MITQTYNDIVTPELIYGAIFNFEFEGFKSDYEIIHCLIRKYNPKSFFEVGTNFGTGTKIIKNAVGGNVVVFSLDLPTELIHPSLQPSPDKKTDKVGSNCNLPFIQLRGDSLSFDFSKYPCEGYFVDAAHFYDNVFRETTEILKLTPKLIVWHDSDIPEVMKAIKDSFYRHDIPTQYDIFVVQNTRITYAKRKMEEKHSL